jgi:hypothetical protein
MKKPTREIRDERERLGVRAIQYLQSMAGIEEPFDRALNAWRTMSKLDQINTIAAYETFCPNPSN